MKEANAAQYSCSPPHFCVGSGTQDFTIEIADWDTRSGDPYDVAFAGYLNVAKTQKFVKYKDVFSKQVDFVQNFQALKILPLQVALVFNTSISIAGSLAVSNTNAQFEGEIGLGYPCLLVFDRLTGDVDAKVCFTDLQAYEPAFMASTAITGKRDQKQVYVALRVMDNAAKFEKMFGTGQKQSYYIIAGTNTNPSDANYKETFYQGLDFHDSYNSFCDENGERCLQKMVSIDAVSQGDLYLVGGFIMTSDSRIRPFVAAQFPNMANMEFDYLSQVNSIMFALYTMQQFAYLGEEMVGVNKDIYTGFLFMQDQTNGPAINAGYIKWDPITKKKSTTNGCKYVFLNYLAQNSRLVQARPHFNIIEDPLCVRISFLVTDVLKSEVWLWTVKDCQGNSMKKKRVDSMWSSQMQFVNGFILKKTKDLDTDDFMLAIIANSKFEQGFWTKSWSDMTGFLGSSRNYGSFFYSNFQDTTIGSFDPSTVPYEVTGQYSFTYPSTSGAESMSISYALSEAVQNLDTTAQVTDVFMSMKSFEAPDTQLFGNAPITVTGKMNLKSDITFPVDAAVVDSCIEFRDLQYRLERMTTTQNVFLTEFSPNPFASEFNSFIDSSKKLIMRFNLATIPALTDEGIVQQFSSSLSFNLGGVFSSQSLQVTLDLCPAMPSFNAVSYAFLSNLIPTTTLDPSLFSDYTCGVGLTQIKDNGELTSNHFNLDQDASTITPKTSIYTQGEFNQQLQGTHVLKFVGDDSQTMDIDGTPTPLESKEIEVNILISDPCKIAGKITLNPSDTIDYTKNVADRVLVGVQKDLSLPTANDPALGWTNEYVDAVSNTNLDCGYVGNYQIESVEVEKAYSTYITANIQKVKDALSITLNGQGLDLRVANLNDAKISGNFKVQMSVGTSSPLLSMPAAWTPTYPTLPKAEFFVKLTIYDECFDAILSSSDSAKTFEATMLEKTSVTFQSISVAGNETTSCGDPSFSASVWIQKDKVTSTVYLEAQLSTNMIDFELSEAIQTKIVADYTSMKAFKAAGGLLYLNVTSSLSGVHSLYPSSQFFFKLAVSPCKLTKVTAGTFNASSTLSLTVPLDTWKLDPEPSDVFLSFSGYSYEPANCKLDNTALKFIYSIVSTSNSSTTANLTSSEVYTQTLAADDTSLSSFQNQSGAPVFVQNMQDSQTGLNVIKVLKEATAGAYQIAVRAQIYNPFNDTVVVNEELWFSLNVVAKQGTIDPNLSLALALSATDTVVDATTVADPVRFKEDPVALITVNATVEVIEGDEDGQNKIQSSSSLFDFELPEIISSQADTLETSADLSNLDQISQFLKPSNKLQFLQSFQLSENKAANVRSMSESEILQKLGVKLLSFISITLKEGISEKKYNFQVLYRIAKVKKGKEVVIDFENGEVVTEALLVVDSTETIETISIETTLEETKTSSTSTLSQQDQSSSISLVSQGSDSSSREVKVDPVQTPKQAEVIVPFVTTFNFNIVPERKAENKPVSDIAPEVIAQPAEKRTAPQISSVLMNDKGSCTFTFSKNMMFSKNWVQKHLNDAKLNSIDASLVDSLSTPLIKFWFEQANFEGRQVQIPEEDVSITVMTQTQIVFQISFESLDDPQAISLTSSTEQDLLAVQIPKQLTLNDQAGKSLILDPSSFDEEEEDSFFISTTLEPQKIEATEVRTEAVQGAVNTAPGLTVFSSLGSLAGSVLSKGEGAEDLSNDLASEQQSAMGSAFKGIQPGQVNGYNKNMQKAAGMDYKALDFFSSRNMTWTSQPPSNDGLKRTGIQTKNFPKTIGATIFCGGGALVLGNLAIPVFEAASTALQFEGGEPVLSDQVQMIKLKFKKSLSSPMTPTINALIGMVFIKILLGGIVNTENSHLVTWDNFGPYGILSAGDQFSIIAGYLGLLTGFVIMIMLTVTLVANVSWMFNFGKKVVGIENILRRKQNHKWFMFTLGQMRTFTTVYFIIFYTAPSFAVPQILLSIIVNPSNFLFCLNLKPLPKVHKIDLTTILKVSDLISIIVLYFQLMMTEINDPKVPFKIAIGWFILVLGQMKFYMMKFNLTVSQFMLHKNKLIALSDWLFCLKQREKKFTREERFFNNSRTQLIDEYRLRYKSKFYKLDKLPLNAKSHQRVAPIEAFRKPKAKKVEGNMYEKREEQKHQQKLQQSQLVADKLGRFTRSKSQTHLQFPKVEHEKQMVSQLKDRKKLEVIDEQKGESGSSMEMEMYQVEMEQYFSTHFSSGVPMSDKNTHSDKED